MGNGAITYDKCPAKIEIENIKDDVKGNSKQIQLDRVALSKEIGGVKKMLYAFLLTLLGAIMASGFTIWITIMLKIQGG